MDLDSLVVSQIMSAPVTTLSAGQSLPLAEELMDQQRIRHIPVVDENERMVGLVTHRDLLRARLSDLGGATDQERKQLQLAAPVRWLMTSDVWTTRPEALVLDVAQSLRDNKFGCIPVVDDQDRVVGIVTEADFVSLVVRVLPHFKNRRVQDVMSRDLLTLGQRQSLSLAGELMSMRHVRHIPVVDDDEHLVGLVTHRDLLSAQHSALSGASPLELKVAVADIMREDIWTITPEARLVDAAQTLADHRFGCLPVVEDGRLVGILTEADLLTLLVDRLAAPLVTQTSADAPINYFMTEPARVVEVDAPLEDAQARMEGFGVSCLGVIAERGSLVGVVSRTDLIAARKVRRTPAMRIRSYPTLVLPKDPVSAIMTRDVATTTRHASVAAAATQMVERAVHRLFVIEDEHPVGVISATDYFDVVRALRVVNPISDFMSEFLISISADESVASALRLLSDAAVSSVLVRDANWVVGLFGQREALEARSVPDDTPLDRIMSQRVVCVPQTLPTHLAAGQAAGLAARMVVGMHGDEPRGIVTAMDFVRIVTDSRTRG